jgi:plasmid stabilization system protein ParE
VNISRTRSFDRRFDELWEFYERKNRLRAVEKFVDALREAIDFVAADATSDQCRR